MDNMENKADFYFIAIGGVGQSALAKILLQLGYCVCGSDIKESKYTNFLKESGAKVFIGHDEKNIETAVKIDKDNCKNTKVVVSSAIKENNPELLKAKELNLEIIHRSDCLKIISELFEKFTGFAGTHGKTTTSGLFSFILEKLNQNPSYAVGGIIPKINKNAYASKASKHFIAELDESDGTIQKYSPDYFVINNLEADHLDFYKNGLCDIIPVFEKVCENMLQKQNSKVFVNIDNQGINEFLKQTKFKNIITYSIETTADYQAKNIKLEDLSSSFEVYHKNNFLGKANLIIPGVYNIYNALAVISVLGEIGFQFDDYSKYLSEFSGMGRRFQIVCDVNDIKIIDDYAHHPSEIKSTLSAVKDLKRRKVAIFQPHRYTRLKGLWDEFLKSFDFVDKLFVLETYNAGDEFDKEFNSENFALEINKKGLNAQYIQGTITEAGKKIAPKLSKGDIVLTLGAGDVTKIGGVINDLLSK